MFSEYPGCHLDFSRVFLSLNVKFGCSCTSQLSLGPYSRWHARSSAATACSELCVVKRLWPPQAEPCRLCSPPMPGAVTAWPHALTLTPALQEACTRKTLLFIERFMEHDGPCGLAKDKTKKNQINTVNHYTHLRVSGSFVWKVDHMLAVYY